MNPKFERILHLVCWVLVGGLFGSFVTGAEMLFPSGHEGLVLRVVLPPIIGALIAAVVWQLFLGKRLRRGPGEKPSLFSVRDLCFVIFVLAVVLSLCRWIGYYI